MPSFIEFLLSNLVIVKISTVCRRNRTYLQTRRTAAGSHDPAREPEPPVQLPLRGLGSTQPPTNNVVPEREMAEGAAVKPQAPGYDIRERFWSHRLRIQSQQHILSAAQEMEPGACVCGIKSQDGGEIQRHDHTQSPVWVFIIMKPTLLPRNSKQNVTFPYQLSQRSSGWTPTTARPRTLDLLWSCLPWYGPTHLQPSPL